MSERDRVRQFTWRTGVAQRTTVCGLFQREGEHMIVDVPFHTPPDAGFVCQALAAGGHRYRPSQLAIEAREDRWLVRLPDQRLAWLARSALGRERLRRERRVLRLIEQRCSFEAPRVLFESADGELDLRSMVPGTADPRRFYAEVRDSSERAIRIGTAVGAMLVEQHTSIGAADVTPWLPRRASWPEAPDWIRERLPRVVDNRRLIARAEAVIAAYENVVVEDADRVLVHTDIGFHNLAIDGELYTVRGIFDYDGAAWADRHHDFRYLLFDFARPEMLEAACSVYEPAIGRPIRRDRVLLYNAACAVTFLAFRAGHGADERWCGRTLVEDVQWSEEAIAKALPLLDRASGRV